MKVRSPLAAGLLATATSAALIMSAGPASAIPQLGSTTVTPNHDLVNNQVVAAHVSGFGNENQTVYAGECSTALLSDPTFNEQNNCDTDTLVTTTLTNGSGDFQFTVLTTSYVDNAGHKCDYAHACDLVVTDNTTAASANYASLTPLHFKDTRVASKTTVKAAHKSVKKGKKDTFTATTTKAAAAAGGKVTFTYGSHKKTVKEKASGKVKATFKITKSGTVKATFSGNSSYKASSGKVKVKAKK